MYGFALTGTIVHVFSQTHTLPLVFRLNNCWCGVDRNAAIFPLDDPSMTPLTGDSTIVVVNDARHQLEGNFLQRTVPYFFELTGGHPTVASGGRYRWAKV